MRSLIWMHVSIWMHMQASKMELENPIYMNLCELIKLGHILQNHKHLKKEITWNFPNNRTTYRCYFKILGFCTSNIQSSWLFSNTIKKKGLITICRVFFWSFMFWYYHPPNITSYDFIQFIQNPTNLPWDLSRQSCYGVFVCEVV